MVTRTPEQDERRTHALDAVRDGLHDDLREIGWQRVFETIEAGWTIFCDGRPVSRLPLNERMAWVSLLGHLEAQVVQRALREWPATEQGAHCPKPAELANMLSGRSRQDGPQPTNQPQHTRRDQQPEVLLFVASLLDRGELVCECAPAPATLVQDSAGVLWCPGCSGIEMGQADQAREHVSPSPDADVFFHDLSAVVRLKRIRERRAARELEERVTG